MTLLDILILVMVVGGGFWGWHRRFTGQLGSIAGLLLGMILCRVFAPGIIDYFNQPDDTVQTKLLHTVLTYLLIGAGSYLGVRVAVYMVRSMLRALHLGIIDRVAGALFSVFQWLLGLSVVLNVWLAVFPDSDLRTDSQDAVDAVLSLAPAVFGSDTAKNILSAELPGGKTPDNNDNNSDNAEGSDNSAQSLS
jgi:uncharacterized membrane protein required for colicin V production